MGVNEEPPKAEDKAEKVAEEVNEEDAEDSEDDDTEFDEDGKQSHDYFLTIHSFTFFAFKVQVQI